MFGPHFYFDLVRLARKPRNVLLRCGYLLSLLIGCWVVYETTKPTHGRINEFAELAVRYTRALLIFQYALIFLLTPLYLAGVIVEERENGTLGLLFQTELSEAEILKGKFAARIVHLLLLTISSLPLSTIVSFWGGVSLEWLALHYLFCLCLIILVGSAGMVASVVTLRMIDALLLAYGCSACVAVVLIMPLLLLERQQFSLGQSGLALLVAVPLMLAASWGCYRLALGQLRQLRKVWCEGPEMSPRGLRPRNRLRRRRTVPTSIPDAALLWKELRQRQFYNEAPPEAYWLFHGLFAVIPVFGAIAQLDGTDVTPVPVMCFIAFFLLLGTFALLMALGTTASVAREREHGTLDFLLLLPIDRRAILWYKWVAPWVRYRVILAGLPIIAVTGVVTGMFSASGGVALLLLPILPLLALSGLALVISITCSTVMRANVVLAACVLAALLAHLMFWTRTDALLHGYFALLTGGEPTIPFEPIEIYGPVAMQQTAFLLFAAACFRISFRLFDSPRVAP